MSARGIAYLSSWNSTGGHSHHRHRHHSRRSSPSAPAFVRYTVLALAAILIVTLVWRGIRWTMHPRNAAANAASPLIAIDPRATLWQLDFTQTLEAAAHDAAAGNISSAEMGVDRAESTITMARLINASAPPDFFASALAELDQIVKEHPGDERLFEHVTLARISLAELRSSQNTDPSATPSGDKSVVRLSIGAPREIDANQTLDPATLGGSYLDATLMPDTSEILLPPASRTFADHTRVENVTIEGAAQTLDGIRWHNVTFIGTRLRYEGGQLDLQNVQCVRCRFGFTTDDRGAHLATAIALGQTSFTTE